MGSDYVSRQGNYCGGRGWLNRVDELNVFTRESLSDKIEDAEKRLTYKRFLTQIPIACFNSIQILFVDICSKT